MYQISGKIGWFKLLHVFSFHTFTLTNDLKTGHGLTTCTWISFIFLTITISFLVLHKFQNCNSKLQFNLVYNGCLKLEGEWTEEIIFRLFNRCSNRRMFKYFDSINICFKALKKWHNCLSPWATTEFAEKTFYNAIRAMNVDYYFAT